MTTSVAVAGAEDMGEDKGEDKGEDRGGAEGWIAAILTAWSASAGSLTASTLLDKPA